MRLRFSVRTLGLALALAGALITTSLSAFVPEFFDGGGSGPTPETAVQAAIWDPETTASAYQLFTCELVGEPAVIKAPPADIYRAYVDPNALVRCLPPGGMKGRIETFDPRDGGEYRIVLSYMDAHQSATGKTTRNADVVHGRFLELVQDRKIVQSVQFESADPRFAGEMKLTWQLKPTPEGTPVVITAENVPDGITRADHEAGFAATLDNSGGLRRGSVDSIDFVLQLRRAD